MKRMSLGLNDWGHETEIHVSESEIVTVEKQGNVQSILDANQRLRNAGGGPRRSGMHHVGRIDLVTWHNWRKEWKQHHAQNWTWPTYLAAKLRDPDYSKFRTSDMRA